MTTLLQAWWLGSLADTVGGTKLRHNPRLQGHGNTYSTLVRGTKIWSFQARGITKRHLWTDEVQSVPPLSRRNIKVTFSSRLTLHQPGLGNVQAWGDLQTVQLEEARSCILLWCLPPSWEIHWTTKVSRKILTHI